MCEPVWPGNSGPQGEIIGRVRSYGAVSAIAFGGRRRRVYRRIVALSGARPGDRVLDVGCSGGYLARLLATAVTPGGQVTGIDPATAAITYARRRAPGNCSFTVGTAQELGVPGGSFDVVTSTLAIHHIPEPARRRSVRCTGHSVPGAGCWSPTSARPAVVWPCIPAAGPCAIATPH